MPEANVSGGRGVHNGATNHRLLAGIAVVSTSINATNRGFFVFEEIGAMFDRDTFGMVY